MEEKRLKIAIFVDVFFPMVDGVINVVDNYARRLAKVADVTVFCPKPKEKQYDDSVYPYRVVRCKSMHSRRADYVVGVPSLDGKFKKILKTEHFDIVHVHSPFFVGKQGVKYAKRHGVPAVATIHSQYKRDFLQVTGNAFIAKRLLKTIMKVFNSCDECWTVNDACRKIFIEEYGLKVPCRLRSNATDMLPVDGTAASEWTKAELGIGEEEHVLLFSGRMVLVKNLLFLADSLKLVKDAGVKFRMVFLGKGPDEDKLKHRLDKNGLLDCVLFPGRLTDRTHVAYLCNRAELFVFPSLYDTNSLVQIEAASQRTPTLFIRGSATSATATENVDALMSENTAEDFANKIIFALTNEQELKKIGDGAFERLYRTWDSVVDETYARYLELIEQKKGDAERPDNRK